MAGSAHFDTDWSALDDIAPDLRKYLSIPNLRPLLRARHLLTGDELEQVEISSANPTTQAIDRYLIGHAKFGHFVDVFSLFTHLCTVPKLSFLQVNEVEPVCVCVYTLMRNVNNQETVTILLLWTGCTSFYLPKAYESYILV